MPFPVLAAIAGGKLVYDAFKANSATKDFNAAAAQRKPYQTPDELYKILNATSNNAQQGYDPITLNYLTNQTGQAFSQGLGTLQRLNGDPNASAALFDQQMQNIMKIGAQNHALGLENFSRYLGALDTIANSKAAEYTSQQDIIKDKMAAANANKQTAFANMSNDVNLGISAFAANATNNLYKSANGTSVATPVTGSGSGSYSIGNDPLAPPQSIINNGITYVWNALSKKYEKAN